MDNSDTNRAPAHAFHGPLSDEDPPPQALHGPLPDEVPHSAQTLHSSLPDAIRPPSQALHGPLPDETPPPPPLALHGPLPDENDPAWDPSATEEQTIPRRSADDSFVSIFNWIRKRFSRNTQRSDGAGANSRSATFPRYSRRSSHLNLRGQDSEKGTSTATAAVDGQSSTTTAAADGTLTSTPQSHASAVLKPAPDYAKMGDTGSGSGSSNDAMQGHMTKVKDFIRQVHELPWASTERVTIDYYPGQSKKRAAVQPRRLQAKGPRHVRSWYSERTSGLLPFTVVSPPATSHGTVDQEVQLRGDNVDAPLPQGYVPSTAEPQLTSQYADLAIH